MTVPVLVGSHAFVQNSGAFSDIDLIGSYVSVIAFAKTYFEKIDQCYPFQNGHKLFIRSGRIILEAEIAWENTTASEIVNIHANKPPILFENSNAAVVVPDLGFLYTLKMSHRYLRNSPHFLKTMRDILEMRSLLGSSEIPAEYKDFYQRRMASTYNYTHPVLDKSKSSFFSNDGVKYIYDHDSIHHAIKHLDKPAFDYFKPDGNDVLCSKKDFFAAEEKVRLFAVLEETYVLALERSQIPNNFSIDPKKSFLMSLSKVCSSITSGWFRTYAWENYFKVQELYDENYVQKFRDALEASLIKPYETV